MRRAVSCKYISTTPTVSVMETKMGNNLRENESEDGRLDVPCPAVRIGAADRKTRTPLERQERFGTLDATDTQSTEAAIVDNEEGLIFGLE